MHKLSDLKKMIRVKTDYEGKDTFYSAYCPLMCGCKEETRAGRDPFAKAATVGKVVAHLLSVHASEFVDDVA